MNDSAGTRSLPAELNPGLQRNSLAEEVVIGEPGSAFSSLVGKKFYTVSQIIFITLFGTLFAGIYGLAANYRQIDDRRSLRLTWLVASVVTPTYLSAYALLPRTSFDLLFPLLPGVLTGIVAAFLQNRFVRTALQLGAVRRSILDQVMLAGVSLSCVCFLSILIAFIANL